MAGKNHIDWGALAEERLRTGKTMQQQAREHRANSGNGGAKTEAKPEPHGAKATSEAKPAYQSRGVAVAEHRHAERREPKVLPTAEQCEALQDHQEYLFFRDGMWQTFLVETKSLGLTEDQRREEFMAICQQFLQEDIKVLVQRGNLKNWEQFVAAPAEKPAVDVIPEGGFDNDQDVEILSDGSVALRSSESAESVLEGESKYLDRDATSPLLSKFFALTGEQQEQSGIDIDMLFDFLEGTGKVDEDFFPAMIDGNIVTKEQYLAEAKKLESYFSPKNGTADSRTEAQPSGSAETSRESKLEAKDWREVKRDVEVDAVGDLHSNLTALKENLKTLGVAREKSDGTLEWTGSNRKLVLIGDILADRNTQGLDILLALDKLKTEASAASGHIDVLAGNHDDFFTSYLMGRSIAGGGNPVENSQLGDQGLGLLELSDFGPDELKNYDWSKFQRERTFEKEINGKIEQVSVYDLVWELMQKYRGTILENMRNSEKGRKILEGLCDMKLAVVQDDNLFVHTDITPEMADFLLTKNGNIREAADFINARYQENLRRVLLEGKEPEAQFDSLRTLFLCTDNRINFDDLNERVPSHFTKDQLANMPDNFFQKQDAERARISGEIPKTIAKFKQQGINAIFHGHSGVHAGVGISNPNFPVESIDLSSFKHGKSDDRRSVLRVKTDGTLEKGTNANLSTAAGKHMTEIRTR